MNTYLGERRLTGIRDHRKRRNYLLLDVPLRSLRSVRRSRVEELEKTLDNRVKVRDERFPFNSLAEVDECRCCMCMDSVCAAERIQE